MQRHEHGQTLKAGYYLCFLLLVESGADLTTPNCLDGGGTWDLHVYTGAPPPPPTGRRLEEQVASASTAEAVVADEGHRRLQTPAPLAARCRQDKPHRRATSSATHAATTMRRATKRIAVPKTRQAIHASVSAAAAMGKCRFATRSPIHTSTQGDSWQSVRVRVSFCHFNYHEEQRTYSSRSAFMRATKSSASSAPARRRLALGADEALGRLRVVGHAGGALSARRRAARSTAQR